MQITSLEARRGEAGFTLVELAIVMIIIGLLIGGILKGQELIANAQLTATVAQIKGLEGSVATFRDKYSAMPGDMANAGTRLRDCTGACATGNPAGRRGNGRIDTPVNLGAQVNGTSEGLLAFTHMAAADLITGVDISNPGIAFGSALPEAKIGGGFWIGYTNNGSAQGGVTAMRAGHYLVMNGTTDAVTNVTGGVTASQAAQIDRKMDDGAPTSGGVQATTGRNCRVGGGANARYNESVEDSSCSVYIRSQS